MDYSCENGFSPMNEQMLRRAFASVGILCPDDRLPLLIRYFELLTERNRVMNLTRITDPEEVAAKHFADSLLGMSLIPENASVVDVGSGAGFPGLPIAIVRPDVRLTMVDSLAKRVSFLNDVVRELGLGSRAIHARAEDAARDDSLRAHFDAALSRAVAPMNVLAELTVPFLKVGGASLMYKGPGTAEELEASKGALSKLRSEAELVHFDTPWGVRNIVIVRKLEKTPSAYPRKAGTASKKPLN